MSDSQSLVDLPYKKRKKKENSFTKLHVAHLWYALLLQDVSEDGQNLCVGEAIISLHVQEVASLFSQSFTAFLLFFGKFFALSDMMSEATQKMAKVELSGLAQLNRLAGIFINCVRQQAQAHFVQELVS